VTPYDRRHRTNIVIYTWSCDTLCFYAPYIYREHPMHHIHRYVHVWYMTVYFMIYDSPAKNTVHTLYIYIYICGPPLVYVCLSHIYLWPTFNVCVSLSCYHAMRNSPVNPTCIYIHTTLRIHLGRPHAPPPPPRANRANTPNLCISPQPLHHFGT
jgi:hypothetical protein